MPDSTPLRRQCPDLPDSTYLPLSQALRLQCNIIIIVRSGNGKALIFNYLRIYGQVMARRSRLTFTGPIHPPSKRRGWYAHTPETPLPGVKNSSTGPPPEPKNFQRRSPAPVFLSPEPVFGQRGLPGRQTGTRRLNNTYQILFFKPIGYTTLLLILKSVYGIVVV